MKRFQNILYIAEADQDQATAIERAVSLAENHMARLTMLDVLPSVQDDFWSEMLEVRRSELQQLAELYQHRMTIEIEVRMGRRFLETVRSVLNKGYDLVIKPAEDTEIFSRVFGSDDMHLLRKCPCPVWIMKLPEKPNYTNILAAIDFKPMDSSPDDMQLNQNILDLAAAMAIADSARLHIVHCWDAVAEKFLVSRGIPEEGIAVYVEKQRRMHEMGMNRIMETLRNRMGVDAYNYIEPLVHMRKGTAKREIPELAAALKTDLVIMGTVGRTGIAGWIVGNTAETILNQLSCSVLAVKPPGFITPVKPAEWNDGS